MSVVVTVCGSVGKFDHDIICRDVQLFTISLV